MRRRDAVVLTAVKGVFGALLATGFALSPVVYAHKSPAPASSSARGEDSVGWDCRVDGNRVCGPDNASGVRAGCYDDRGVFVAALPCRVVVGADGSADIFR